jgi:aminopeptidase N
MMQFSLDRACRGILAVVAVLVAAVQPVAAQTEPPPVPAGRVPEPGPYLPGFDALHYDLRITLPDAGTTIEAVATVDIARTDPSRDTLRLDLSGLRVTRVRVGTGGALSDAGFRQHDGRLFIALPAAARPDTLRVVVAYDGTPDDGLILRENVHGSPSAFADNWPDRARFWFPSVDHPSDKATVTYEVRAPRHWRVIANGRRTDTTDDGVWNYEVRVPIPTYAMVIGGTELSVGTIDECAQGGRTELRPDGCVVVTSWTFPQDSANGARIFRRGGDMIRYYTDRFGPFPYEKLAHVQSATRFGGMENVGAIFYSEQALQRGTLGEVTVAHETAHQWFGDAVTPLTWNHLWLSEGFATYFGMQYFEESDGVERFRELVHASGEGYLDSDVTGIPVVDSLRVPEDDLFSLLNSNSYNKGGQVLHMLRGLLGDESFFRAVREYYQSHVNGTAQTRDLQAVFERVSGQELGWFFDQWIYRPGYPIFRVTQEWIAESGETRVVLEQVQSQDWPTFRIPNLEIEIETPAGPVRQRVDVQQRRVEVRVRTSAAPAGVRVDPDGWILERVQG